jgi:hypothetical protein
VDKGLIWEGSGRGIRRYVARRPVILFTIRLDFSVRRDRDDVCGWNGMDTVDIAREGSVTRRDTLGAAREVGDECSSA